jgi:acetyl esterase/lipase
MSLRTRIIRALLRRRFSSLAEGTIAQRRAQQARSNRFARLPAGSCHRSVSAGGVPAEWIEGPGPVSGVILYLHGGGYVMGSIDTHRAWIARLAQATQMRALAIDYRLAPEHPFPAALEDATTVAAWLLDQREAPGRLIIAGDSAGGGLALATLVALRDAGMPGLAGAVCLSPWTDLTLAGASIQHNARLDPILDAGSLRQYAGMYAGSRPLTDPLISPLYADLTGLPPLLIQAAADEILADDAARFAKKARAAGVEVSLTLQKDAFHVYQLAWPLPEARQALTQIAGFVTRLA